MKRLNAEWWNWLMPGSTKGEIVHVLTPALAGERYSQEALLVRPENLGC